MHSRASSALQALTRALIVAPAPVYCVRVESRRLQVRPRARIVVRVSIANAGVDSVRCVRRVDTLHKMDRHRVKSV